MRLEFRCERPLRNSKSLNCKIATLISKARPRRHPLPFVCVKLLSPRVACEPPKLNSCAAAARRAGARHDNAGRGFVMTDHNPVSTYLAAIGSFDDTDLLVAGHA